MYLSKDLDHIQMKESLWSEVLMIRCRILKKILVLVKIDLKNQALPHTEELPIANGDLIFLKNKCITIVIDIFLYMAMSE